MNDRPVILISSANDAQSTGDASSNGGIKVYNNFANLLIAHGYEAYVVTWTGEPIQWLVHHAPYISIDTARQWKAEGRNLKFMTGWWRSQAFLDLVDKIYFYDCELAFTSDYGHHRGILETWLQSGRIARYATHSKTQAGWYVAAYGFMPLFIPEWSSEDWKPCAEQRVHNRIGFMDESGDTPTEILSINRQLIKLGYDVELQCIGGSEEDVLRQMQSCEVFLGMGHGKHPVLQEGCNRSGQEAQHAGCVVIMYDTVGVREYVFDGYNGYLVPIGDTEAMARRVGELLASYPLREAMRLRSIDYALHYFTPEKRWNAVAEFLELEP